MFNLFKKKDFSSHIDKEEIDKLVLNGHKDAEDVLRVFLNLFKNDLLEETALVEKTQQVIKEIYNENASTTDIIKYKKDLDELNKQQFQLGAQYMYLEEELPKVLKQIKKTSDALINIIMQDNAMHNKIIKKIKE